MRRAWTEGPSDGEPALSPIPTKLGPNASFRKRAFPVGRVTHPAGQPETQLTLQSLAVNSDPWGLCDPPTRRHAQVSRPVSSRGRSHVILHHDISRQAFTIDRHGAHACPDRRSHRRGFRRRPAADPRRNQAQAIRMPPTGARNFPAAQPSSSACAGQSSRRARRPGCGMPMLRPRALEGGFEGWKEAKLPLVPAKLPPRDAQGRTVWVTRARPKIDRIACPWLIRRFVDPNAVFLFVAPPRWSRSASASTPPRSTSRTCSGATAANSAPSTS